MAETEKILVTKWIALKATVLITEARKGELSEKFPPFFISQAENLSGFLSAERELAAAERQNALYAREIGEGGILNALWNMASLFSAGLEADIKKIPIRQETVEILETYDLNPYYARSEGSALIVTDRADELCDALDAEGIPCSVIGRLTSSKARILHNGENTRYLDRPQKEELLKLQLQKMRQPDFRQRDSG